MLLRPNQSLACRLFRGLFHVMLFFFFKRRSKSFNRTLGWNGFEPSLPLATVALVQVNNTLFLSPAILYPFKQFKISNLAFNTTQHDKTQREQQFFKSHIKLYEVREVKRGREYMLFFLVFIITEFQYPTPFLLLLSEAMSANDFLGNVTE